MEDIKYSEKEISIFNGLINLMKEGGNPYSIKVSDIALASNVGKGTIYDYFNSKEEVISQAIIYNIENEIRLVLERIHSKKTFKDRFYEVLQIMWDNLRNSFSTFNMLWSIGGIEKFYEHIYEHIIEDGSDLSRCMPIINREVNSLLALGSMEGIINITESKYYQIMAVQGAISGFYHYISRKDLHQEINIEEAMDISYRILVKSLN